MTEKQPLKLVVAYDRNRNEYSIAAHNQTPEEAEGYVTRWSPHLHPDSSFLMLAQTSRHRTEEVRDCRACRETVARSANLEPKPKLVRRNEP